MGGHLGGVAHGAARAAWTRGIAQRRRARQPDGEVGGKRGSKDDLVGYDAGKRVKGRKIHALVDTEGMPLRVVVHSAGMQDRDGAALVLSRIRTRFPWLELVWADAGYDARQARWRSRSFPSCSWRLSDAATTRRASKSSRAAGWSSGPSPGSAVTDGCQRLREPRQYPGGFRRHRLDPPRPQAPRPLRITF